VLRWFLEEEEEEDGWQRCFSIRMAPPFRPIEKTEEDPPYDPWSVDDIPIVVFVVSVSLVGIALAGGLTLTAVL